MKAPFVFFGLLLLSPRSSFAAAQNAAKILHCQATYTQSVTERAVSLPDFSAALTYNDNGYLFGTTPVARTADGLYEIIANASQSIGNKRYNVDTVAIIVMNTSTHQKSIVGVKAPNLEALPAQSQDEQQIQINEGGETIDNIGDGRGLYVTCKLR